MKFGKEIIFCSSLTSFIFGSLRKARLRQVNQFLKNLRKDSSTRKFSLLENDGVEKDKKTVDCQQEAFNAPSYRLFHGGCNDIDKKPDQPTWWRDHQLVDSLPKNWRLQKGCCTNEGVRNHLCWTPENELGRRAHIILNQIIDVIAEQRFEDKVQHWRRVKQKY